MKMIISSFLLGISPTSHRRIIFGMTGDLLIYNLSWQTHLTNLLLTFQALLLCMCECSLVSACASTPCAVSLVLPWTRWLIIIWTASNSFFLYSLIYTLQILMDGDFYSGFHVELNQVKMLNFTNKVNIPSKTQASRLKGCSMNPVDHS